jgi:hypothetical protein
MSIADSDIACVNVLKRTPGITQLLNGVGPAISLAGGFGSDGKAMPAGFCLCDGTMS